MIEMKPIEVSLLTPAPWRFSEDQKLAHGSTRYYSPIQHNVEVSLQRDGQIAPIHVRVNSNTSMMPIVHQVLDGHIVVDAARKLGLKSLLAILHLGLTDEQALLRYIMLNLNRCGQYGHYHVKIHRSLAKLFPTLDAEKRAAKLEEYMSWPHDRIKDYVELSERDTNWEKFMFIPEDEGEQTSIFTGQEVDPAPDHQ